MKKTTKTLKSQLKEMINRGDSLVTIINFLFTCDYSPIEVVKILVKDFKCNTQLVKDTFWIDFGMELDSFVNSYAE